MKTVCNQMDSNFPGKDGIDDGANVTYTYNSFVRQGEQDLSTKLTLRLDPELISKAKAYAKKRGKSLSRLVADYFAALQAKERQPIKDHTPPLTAALWGLLQGTGVDQRDYHKYLEKKHSNKRR